MGHSAKRISTTECIGPKQRQHTHTYIQRHTEEPFKSTTTKTNPPLQSSAYEYNLEFRFRTPIESVSMCLCMIHQIHIKRAVVQQAVSKHTHTRLHVSCIQRHMAHVYIKRIDHIRPWDMQSATRPKTNRRREIKSARWRELRAQRNAAEPVPKNHPQTTLQYNIVDIQYICSMHVCTKTASAICALICVHRTCIRYTSMLIIQQTDTMMWCWGMIYYRHIRRTSVMQQT